MDVCVPGLSIWIDGGGEKVMRGGGGPGDFPFGVYKSWNLLNKT